MSLTNRDMKGQYKKIMYQILSFIQDVIFYVVNYLLSFLDHIKSIFNFLLYLNEYHRTPLVYPSLKAVNISPSCITDLDQSLPYKSCDDHSQVGEHHEIKDNLISLVLNPKPSNIQDIYKPIQFPYFLHDFPTKHYKYLPRFEGEFDNLIIEKHVQYFENFTDLFEVEHDDVCMRSFSQ